MQQHNASGSNAQRIDELDKEKPYVMPLLIESISFEAQKISLRH